MDYKQRTLLLQRASESAGRKWSVLEGGEEQELINIRDIIQLKDAADTEMHVSEVLIGSLMETMLFRLFIIVVITLNCITIGIQTNDLIAKKYDIEFTICEHIILTVFIWELLVKWYYGFKIFWKSGWNIIDGVVTLCLIVGPMLLSHSGANVLKIIRVLRVIRSVRGFASLQGVSVIVHVIMQSIPDMATIFLLLGIIMLVFAVFGVTLFSAAVPYAFGDLSSALYTLFICITQDGWMAIYREFYKEEEGLMYGASIYFFIFLTGGAFIFANLLVAVVTTNLEICMFDSEENKDKDNEATEGQNLIHVEDVVTRTIMVRRQRPWKASRLENLTLDTLEEYILVLSTLQKNMDSYKQIRQELDSIVDELHSLSFNKEQEQEVILRNQAHVIDSGTPSPGLFQKGMRHAAMRRSMGTVDNNPPTTPTDEQTEEPSPSTE
ncbi:cation channel sperm-associated protein 4-like isoform X2 [Hypomesus transpacificus]|uniref:cation channel sperm-associated protein 4-like isoform X2 n=1 Tax=Hypomesus transpacificus TaxID=137520 RepID=UPI001F0746C4|nr:cation channel sperm-associated protein 4-like isoform X2 [Hypomesus transpacificus]